MTCFCCIPIVIQRTLSHWECAAGLIDSYSTTTFKTFSLYHTIANWHLPVSRFLWPVELLISQPRDLFMRVASWRSSLTGVRATRSLLLSACTEVDYTAKIWTNLLLKLELIQISPDKHCLVFVN
jgi:hypothetical protein